MPLEVRSKRCLSRKMALKWSAKCESKASLFEDCSRVRELEDANSSNFSRQVRRNSRDWVSLYRLGIFTKDGRSTFLVETIMKVKRALSYESEVQTDMAGIDRLVQSKNNV